MGGLLAGQTGLNAYSAPTAIPPAIIREISLQGRSPSRPLCAPQRPRVPPGTPRHPPRRMISAPLGNLPAPPDARSSPPLRARRLPTPCSLCATASTLSPAPLHRFPPFFLQSYFNSVSMYIHDSIIALQWRKQGGMPAAPHAAPKSASASAWP